MSPRLTVGSLFSGIGGLDAGLELAGLGPVLWQVEIDPFCQRVLAAHWRNTARFADVRGVGAATLAAVDVICGGFPCQDVSLAGRGAGLGGARSGLWKEYARIVREMQPPFVVVENVSGLVRRGLEQVVSDLVDAGYAVEATRVRASDLGAPHRRERLFVVAHIDRQSGRGMANPTRQRREGIGAARERHALPPFGGEGVADADGPRESEQGRAERSQRGRALDGGSDVADAERDSLRLEPERDQREGRGVRAPQRGDAAPVHDCAPRRRSAQPGMGGGPHGAADWLDGRWPSRPGEPQHEWEPPRVAEGVPDRAARLMALGNAVVPACVAIAGARILEIARAQAAARE